MKTKEHMAMSGVRELCASLSNEISNWERGGRKPSLYDIKNALNSIVDFVEEKI